MKLLNYIANSIISTAIGIIALSFIGYGFTNVLLNIEKHKKQKSSLIIMG